LLAVTRNFRALSVLLQAASAARGRKGNPFAMGMGPGLGLASRAQATKEPLRRHSRNSDCVFDRARKDTFLLKPGERCAALLSIHG
jgi:hypothetical protein